MVFALVILVLSVGHSMQQCTNGSIRLSSQQYGAVDVCLSGTWGSICSDYWDNKDASVICRQLGFSPYGALGPTATTQTSSSAPLHNIIDVNCTGQERSILDCPFNGLIGEYTCSTSRDANVYCQDSNLATYSNCTDGQMRLVGGFSQFQGRVEVCVNNAWGTVCSRSWSKSDAKVVCKYVGALEIGYHYGSVTSLVFNSGQGPILLGYLYCSGLENSLVDCNQNYYITNYDSSCSQHSNDAAVICEPHCNNGTIRLKGGNYTYGRVEICINEIWTTICSDHWNYKDASVVCNQLGYSPYGAIPASGYYTETIWSTSIVNPNCTGNEVSIFNCSHSQTGSCLPSHDASLICQDVTLEPASCVSGDVRLVGGSAENEGRLEVCINQLWGTVCNQQWDIKDTRVACKQLGYQEFGGVQYSSSVYGQGTGPVFLGYMSCTGSEDSILECDRSVFKVIRGRCSNHYYDIGLKCEPLCEDGSVRLQEGTSSTGRVELCINGTWGTVCSDFWDNNDASVVCSQLRYSPYGAIANSVKYYSTSVWPHHIIDLNCTGTEVDILSCSYSRPYESYHTCSSTNDAAVVCQSNDTRKENCIDGSLRLKNGQTEYEGRVEICINNAWGTICGYGREEYWDPANSDVVCKQMGHMKVGSIPYTTASQFGQGTGPIFLSSLQCKGNERNILNCSYEWTHSSFCSHYYDVGVKCEAPCVNGTVRLYSESGSYFRRYGRVQVCVNNDWGTVCNHFWDAHDASVVCNMLGYSPYGASALTDVFTEGVWYVHIKDLNCTGSESSIWDCPMNGLSQYSCNHYDDAAVVCQLPDVINSNCTTDEVRLTGGSDQHEGRVEYCVNGVWQSICDYEWDDVDASTLCGQLGYQGGESIPNSYFGVGETPLSIYFLSCQDNSPNLSQCTWNMLPSYAYCNNYQEAGVICKSPCTDGSVDLFASPLENVGSVRVCINGSWSKICGAGSTLLNNELASVACYSAGFSKYGAKSYQGYWFERSYHFKYFNVRCHGNESNLHECQCDTEGLCSIHQALAVSCQRGSNKSPVNCTDGDVQLFGESSNEGILLICVNKAWTRICADNRYNYWSEANTNVLCHQLGYTIHENTEKIVSYKHLHPTAYQRFDCKGSEDNLSSCSLAFYYSTPQYCHQTIEITCAKRCTTGDILLFGGHYFGRVEVCIAGVWGTICRDSFWDNNDASVICRQLGFSPYGAIAVSTKWFTDAAIYSILNGPNCLGNETTILTCPLSNVPSFCHERNDANVICPIHSSTYSNCTDGDIKLLNGSTKYEGRVEICINKAWGTITYFYGSYNEAQTVCNQLGYTAPGAITMLNAFFGEGSSPVLLTDVYCSSPKDSLLNCFIRYTSRVSNRNRNLVIGVKCQPFCDHGSIRLTGLDPLQGHVEVCVNGTWGSLCNDYWHNNDASVVCRQLGFDPEGAIARVFNDYSTDLSFHIIDLNCNGSELTVLDCSYNNVQQHSCRWYEVAYVQCRIPDTTDNCTNGAVRLVKGETEYEGLVEICADSSWGYICPHSWRETEAMITCRQLGYTAIGATTSSSFGKGAGPVHFSSFYCLGNENKLLDCWHYTSSCPYSYYAGVICPAPCINGEVRLQGDSRYKSFGRVEVCVNGTWGTICDDYWDNNDASVVCNQLGFSPYGAIAKTSFYEESILPHVMFNMSCTGNEETIFNCSYSTKLPSGSDCHSTEDASVICQDINVPHSNCTDYDVKLVGGETGNEGIVLMCLNGVWGALCDYNFKDSDAGVVCHSAGYSKSGLRYSSHFPHSFNEVLLVTDIYCSPTDERIQDCSISQYTPPSSCDVLDIVAVSCQNCTNGDIRIAPGYSPSDSVGRVDVCSDSSWGTICSDFFDDSDAQVVCRQLGYLAIGSGSIGPFLGDVHYHHIIDINCTGNESNIRDCPSNNLPSYFCQSTNDAGVYCNSVPLNEYTNCTDGELRLAGGTELRGRVEMCYNRVWYGICSDSYNRYNIPTTICKGLGHSPQGAVGSIVEEYPPLPLLPYEFKCYLKRDSLWDCYKSITSCSNGPYKYTAVTCQARCNDWEVRLYGSPYDNIGAVQVCIDGDWGSVCHEGFDFSDAATVCTQLGYTPHGSIVLSSNYYRYSRHVNINDLNCTGYEGTVRNCSYTAPKRGNCINAALICQRNNDSVDVTCTDGSIRLTGGANELEGNVEICINKYWGSVCDENWNLNDANVACKQLGHQSSGATVFSRSYFGQKSSSTHTLSNVYCHVTATSLLDCSYNSLSAFTFCGTENIAGIACLDKCDSGIIRLGGSGTESSGRVEVCIDSVWTSLCDQNWDLKDAQVACRDLGYSPFGAVPTYGCYTEGQLSFGITSINCTGYEEALMNCSHSNPVLYNCHSHSDAGLICQNDVRRSNCSDGAVRLVDGSGPYEGRLEVCINEVWGTVCSNGWDNTETNIVCNQLGYLPFGGRYKSFGHGAGLPILMSSLQCIGTESSLLECYQQACSANTCTHSFDVGVVCETPCINGTVRLGDGAVLRGRVEVCYNGSWVTICSHSWTAKEATVICSQLGYSNHGAIAVSYAFIDNEWPMGIYNLNCTGNETSIWDCQFTTLYNGRNCDQSNDASVFCMSNTTEYSNCTDGDVRLAGGSTSSEGNVQICYRNAWGSVCDDSWDIADSNIVCRQLGLQPYGSSAYYYNRYGVYSSFFYGQFYCSGIEGTLLDCPRSSVNYLLNCASYEVAGARCVGTCTDGKIRLSGSYNAHIGMVEVCVNGTWATICDENWDDNDAAVTCHQLGYSSYGAMAAYGAIVSHFQLTRVYDVNCTGSEGLLLDCPVHLLPPNVSYSSCTHNPAGVICQGSYIVYSNCKDGDVRLRNGSTLNQGRVEICINNAWGTVCDNSWNELDGNVVCKQLGYQHVGSKPKYQLSYGLSDLPIMLANVACTGNEETLLECNRNSYSILDCHGYELAGVVCEELCADGEVLIVGSSNLMGRVEVCVNQTWGTVCDTAWNDRAASVVCRQLGFSHYGAIAAKNGFSNLLLPSHIARVSCFGNEDSIFACNVSHGKTKSTCGAKNDAGVICQDVSVTHTNCDHGSLRLVDGHVVTEGRVEICVNGVWGTVCDIGWNTTDANVVCDQLGYYPSGAKARYGSFYGSGSGPIFLSNLHCTGNELSLLECNRDMYSVGQCHHYQDAGVKCLGSFPVYASPSAASMLGGDIIIITGPTFKPNDSIVCEFGDVEVVGGYLTEDKCLCVTPPVANDRIIQLTIKVTHTGSPTLSGGSKFRYVLPFELKEDASPIVNIEDSYSIETGNEVNVTWSKYALTRGLLSNFTVTLNISMILYNTATDEWEESYTLASDVPANDEMAEVFIPELPQIDETTLRLSQIRVSLSTITPSNSQHKRLLPIPFPGILRVGRGILGMVTKATEESKEAERSEQLRLSCEEWYKLDIGVYNKKLPPCPCKVSQARKDDRYTKETFMQNLWIKKLGKATGGCYRQSNVGLYSPSQQCCYNTDGNLLTGVGGGSAYSVYPNNWISLLGHLTADVIPHYLCCDGKYFSGCLNRYYDRRPNDNCKDYPQRLPPARTFGDPHLVSLDGTQYTFNGHGEFILVQSLDGSLMVQARMTEPLSTSDSNETLIGSGTVITAIAAKHNESDTIQFEVVNYQLIVLVNGDEIDFSEIAEQYFKNLTVLDKGNDTISATIANGITITVTKNVNMLADVSVTLSDSYHGSTVGLLGLYNGKPEDDLLSRNGYTTLPSNANTEEIHYKFGLTWIIAKPRDSLFTYDEFGSWGTFYRPEYKPMFEPQFNGSTLEGEAQEICGDDKLCLFDIAATGDVNIGRSTKETGKDLAIFAELLKPIVCDPPCTHGACVNRSTCFCSEGYNGAMCNETTMQDCQENFCLNDATCQIVAGNYLCVCSNGFTGPNCGTKIFSSSFLPTSAGSSSPGHNKAGSATSQNIMIGLAVGVMALVIGIIAVVVCLCVMKKMTVKGNEEDNQLVNEKYELK